MYSRTIGERLKAERERVWLSLDEVSNATRINKRYLNAIENNEFSEFSSHTQAIGFIRNYSNYLKVDPINLIAIYKRDFEAEKKVRKINKVDDEALEKSKNPTKINRFKNLYITSKRVWAGVSLFFIFGFILLAISVYKTAFAPPYFRLTAPTEVINNQNSQYSTSDKTIQIKGETQGYTLIKINEIPLTLSSGFTFQTENLPITDLETKFVITAESQLGVKSESILTVKREDIAKKNEKKEIKISSSKSGVFVKATADGVIQYNDLTIQGNNITLIVNKTLELETDSSVSIVVSLNNKQYLLNGIHVKFEINEDGNLVQSVI